METTGLSLELNPTWSHSNAKISLVHLFTIGGGYVVHIYLSWAGSESSKTSPLICKGYLPGVSESPHSFHNRGEMIVRPLLSREAMRLVRGITIA